MFDHLQNTELETIIVMTIAALVGALIGVIRTRRPMKPATLRSSLQRHRRGFFRKRNIKLKPTGGLIQKLRDAGQI